MNIELRQLSLENDIYEYNMLQDIGANENGFTNEVNGMSFEQYNEWLIQQDIIYEDLTSYMTLLFFCDIM